MTIKVTKPSINLREKLNELEQDTGLKGQELMRADTVAEARTAIGAGRKNLLINGGFDVWQRGTSFTSISSNTYATDRCKTYNSGLTSNVTKNTGVSIDGYTCNTWRMDVTTGASNSYFGFQQILENPLHVGKTYTISAWVKSNDSNMNLFANNGSERAFHTGSGSWEKLTKTFVVDSSTSFGVINYTTSPNTTATGAYVEVAMFQLELGSVATDFEHRSYGEELALCQRYFQTHYTVGSGVQNSSTRAFIYTSLPVAMRVTPTISAKSGDWDNINAERSDTYDISNVHIHHGANEGETGVDGVSSFTTTVDTTGSRTAGEGVCVMMDRNDDEFYFYAEL